MAKILKEAPLTTAAARARLSDGLHWRRMDAEIHIGYRRTVRRSGAWLVRWRAGKGYKQEPIGTADDAMRPDGREVFSYAHAEVEARRIVSVRREEAARAAEGPALPDITVAIAVTEYIAHRQAGERERRGHRPRSYDASSRLGLHVTDDPIAAVKLIALRKDDLRQWRARMTAKKLAASSVTRTANDLRAALNLAADMHSARLPGTVLLEIKAGFKTKAAAAAPARMAVLRDGEVLAIIAAAREVDHETDQNGDLLAMVSLLAATGARWDQIARLKVEDVNLRAGRLSIPVSDKGRGTKLVSHITIPILPDVVALLRPRASKRASTAPLLERDRLKQVAFAEWVKDRRGPWGAASDLARPWRVILARAGLPSDVVPYSLRHSSIVRMLRQNVPVSLVAKLHDTSVEIIERHYGKFIASALDDIAAAAMLSLSPKVSGVADFGKERASRQTKKPVAAQKLKTAARDTVNAA